MPASANTASKRAVNLVSRSRIKNRKASARRPVAEEVASLLGHPFAGRVPRDTEEVDPAGADLEDEERVDAAQQHGVDGEEVTCQHRVRLRAAELPPGRSGPAWCRVQTGPVQDVPHRRGSDAVAEAEEFAVDAPVTPGRVLPRQPEHQRTDHGRRGWSAAGQLRVSGRSSVGRPVRSASAAASPA